MKGYRHTEIQQDSKEKTKSGSAQSSSGALRRQKGTETKPDKKHKTL